MKRCVAASGDVLVHVSQALIIMLVKSQHPGCNNILAKLRRRFLSPAVFRRRDLFDAYQCVCLIPLNNLCSQMHASVDTTAQSTSSGKLYIRIWFAGPAGNYDFRYTYIRTYVFLVCEQPKFLMHAFLKSQLPAGPANQTRTCNLPDDYLCAVASTEGCICEHMFRSGIKQTQ